MKERRGTLLWLIRTAGREKWDIAALLLLQALLGGSGVLFALFLRDLIDRAVAGERILVRPPRL